MKKSEKKIIILVIIASFLLVIYGITDKITTESVKYRGIGPAAALRKSLGIPTIEFSQEGQAVRIQHSFINFLSNASFEYFFEGINTAPTNWFTDQARARRSTDASIGKYSVELVLNSKDGQLAQSFEASPGVKYTFSVFYKRVSGPGSANLVAQEDGGDYTEYASVGLGDKSSGWHIATLTFVKPDDGSDRVRFKIAQTSNTLASTIWRIDEAMAQEGVGLASAFVNNLIDDSTANQNIYASKNFYAGVNLAARYGNVGIGTLATDPNFLLHVAGDSLFNGNLTLNNPGKGIALQSPNGDQFCLTVDNDGKLLVNRGNCQ